MSTHLDLADIQGNILRSYGLQNFPKARYIFLHFGDDNQKVQEFVEALRGEITTAAPWEDDTSDSMDPQMQAAAALKAAHPRLTAAVKALGHKDYHEIARDSGRVPLMKPKVTVNIGLTWWGLVLLGLPIRTLQGMPQEFVDGMAKRASMLGDPGRSDKIQSAQHDHRDPAWLRNSGLTGIQAMVMLNAQMDFATGLPVPELEAKTRMVRDLCAASGDPRLGVSIVGGHGADGKAEWQDASVRFDPEKIKQGQHIPIGKEHFGFTDGFGDPVFKGQYPPGAMKVRVAGHGKIEPDQSWAPLATGEFLLGHPDEAQEVPTAAMPLGFCRNGTFMAWRKLHQNIANFCDHIDTSAVDFCVVAGIGDLDEAKATLRAKMAGRWDDGVPLSIAPTYADRVAFNQRRGAAGSIVDKAKLTLEMFDFKYGDDLDGAKCPVGAHMRRVNTRDMLDPEIDIEDALRSGSALTNRRRIIRRGLPYGDNKRDNESEHGVVFMAICASLFRQFEFVQQQWIQYGLDFNAGNDTCPLLGNHDGETSKFVIPVAKDSATPPFVSGPLTQFVEFRGGDYFFIPSMTALRMMGMGIVDPT